MFCANCGNELEPGSKFCEECGCKVDEDEDEDEAIIEDNAEDEDANVEIVEDDQYESDEDDAEEDEDDESPDGRICSYRGEVVDSGFDFCPKCGHGMNGQAHAFKIDRSKIKIIVIIGVAVLAVILFAVVKGAVSSEPPPPVYEQRYTDEEIANMAFNTFTSKKKSKYGMDAHVLYHGSTLNSSNVEFDETENRYYCTLNAEYTTNIFDFFGTSTTSYVVTAVYYDDGEQLITEEFSYKS